jgi:hypothetical protein
VGLKQHNVHLNDTASQVLFHGWEVGVEVEGRDGGFMNFPITQALHCPLIRALIFTSLGVRGVSKRHVESKRRSSAPRWHDWSFHETLSQAPLSCVVLLKNVPPSWQTQSPGVGTCRDQWNCRNQNRSILHPERQN